jgi:hypothetical protein
MLLISLSLSLSNAHFLSKSRCSWYIITNLIHVGWGLDEQDEEGQKRISSSTTITAFTVGKPDLGLSLRTLMLDVQLERNEQLRYSTRFSKAFRSRSRNRKRLSVSRALLYAV